MHRTLLFIPAQLSALTLAAHLLRGGRSWVALAVALLPLLLFTDRKAAVVALQAVLALAAVEWLRVLVALAGERRELGLPYSRLCVILGCVSLVSAGSAALLIRWRQPLGATAGARS